MKNNFRNHARLKMERAAQDDPDSKLGTYVMVKLKAPDYGQKFEFPLVMITRYRTGSHNLRIEKDRRIPNSIQEDRVCKCNMGVQTIHHVILDCPLLQDSRLKYGVNDIQSGIMNDDFLVEMETVLNIRK